MRQSTFQVRAMMAYNIKRVREDAGLSQIALADLLYTQQPQISRWETGRQMPSASMLRALSIVCQCTLEDFYTPIGAMVGQIVMTGA